jgi:NADPH:quinone reductase and related Zn-dependent oxidoreductases
MTVEYLFERLYKIKKNEKFLFHAAAGGVDDSRRKIS